MWQLSRINKIDRLRDLIEKSIQIEGNIHNEDEDVSDQVLKFFKSSGLDFKIVETPFSINIQIKKKFVKYNESSDSVFHSNLSIIPQNLKYKNGRSFPYSKSACKTMQIHFQKLLYCKKKYGTEIFPKTTVRCSKTSNSSRNVKTQFLFFIGDSLSSSHFFTQSGIQSIHPILSIQS